MGKLLLLSLQHPHTRFILAHVGFSYFREALAFGLVENKLQLASRNVWFDVSVIAVAYANSPVAAELVWTLRQVGMDRVLFGSDWPVDTPGRAAEAVRQLGFTPEEQRRVFHDNAADLLGIKQ
jgi:uncharacterized protein